VLIGKFNRMIRNRVLWGFFAVVVCISFVGAFSSDGGCSRTNPDSAGELFGESVSRREYAIARLFTIGLRDIPSLSPELETRLRNLTWKRLAALRMAKELGVSTTDSEVANEIAGNGTFQQNGSFSRERYAAFLQNQRLSPDIFETYLKEELTLRKLSRMLETAVWSPPAQVASRTRELTDTITLDIVELRPDAGPTPAATIEEAEKFYNDNDHLFREPERVTVRYVPFAYSSFTNTPPVPEDEVAAYYSEREEDFATTDTNGLEIIRPIEEVRTGILDILNARAAALAAQSAAGRFSDSLIADSSGNVPDFLARASEEALCVHTAGPFAVSENVPGVEPSGEFAMEAFSLDENDPERSFSDAVIETNAAYVVSIISRQASYIPAFSNVVERVMPLAASNAAHIAFIAGVESARNAVADSVAAGKPFPDSLAAQGMNISTSVTFAVYDSDPEDIPHFRAIVPEVISLPRNSVTDVVETEGTAVFAFVRERASGESLSMELLKPRVLESMDKQAAGPAFESWTEFVLRELADLKDFTKPAATGSEDESEPPAADGPPGTDTDEYPG